MKLVSENDAGEEKIRGRRKNSQNEQITRKIRRGWSKRKKTSQVTTSSPHSCLTIVNTAPMLQEVYKQGSASLRNNRQSIVIVEFQSVVVRRRRQRGMETWSKRS